MSAIPVKRCSNFGVHILYLYHFMKKTISFKSKYGWISAIENENKIISLLFEKKKNYGNSKSLSLLKKQVNQYFEKKTKTFNVKISLTGSNLHNKILREISKIPFGKVKTYKEIANIFKTSPRYVGNVCSKNKHLIVIPCHRVIRTDGSLGGFSAKGGISLKKKLLIFEK